MSEYILEAKGISKHFGGVKAVEDVSVAVPYGSIYALIGPNGAGKSTFFNTLSGFYPADGGSVTFEGADITTEPNFKRIARGIGRTFQTPSIFPELTVYDNLLIGVQAKKRLAFNLSVPGTGKQREIDEKIDQLLGFVNLASAKRRIVAELSHGSQRLVEIAMSLSTDPKLVLLDEPMAGLAEAETTRVVNVIRDLHDRLGLTVLFVEHNMRVVLSLSHRITVMNRGKMLAEGTPQEIAANADVREAYLGSEVIAHV